MKDEAAVRPRTAPGPSPGEHIKKWMRETVTKEKKKGQPTEYDLLAFQKQTSRSGECCGPCGCGYSCRKGKTWQNTVTSQ